MKGFLIGLLSTIISAFIIALICYLAFYYGWFDQIINWIESIIG